MKRIIRVYTDGSYKNGKGGWAYIAHDNSGMHRPCIAYGSCKAKSNTQIESEACLRAINNIANFNQYDLIEVYTDQIDLVSITRKVAKEKRSVRELIYKLNLKVPEMKRLALIQRLMGARLEFHKAHHEDSYLSMADKYARRALGMGPDDKVYWYMENKDAKAVKRDYIGANQAYSNVLYVLENINRMKSEILPIWVKDIKLIEHIHLDAYSLDLGGDLYRASLGEVDQRPVIVRPIGNDKFGLVTGLKRYCIAKIMDIQQIPAVIVNTDYNIC